MKPISATIALPPLAGLLSVLCCLPAAQAQVGDSATVSVGVRILPFASIEFPDGFDFVLVVPRDDDDDHDHDNDHDHDHDRDHDRDRDHGRDDDHDDRHDKDNGHKTKDKDKDKDKDKWSSGASLGNENHHDDDDHDRRRGIEPVLIGFKIRGNAQASISVRPDDFMRVYRGPYLGEATRQGGDDRHRNQHGNGHSNHGNGHGNGHGQGGGGALGYNAIVQFPIHDWRHARQPSWQGYATNVPNGFASLPGQNGVGTPPLSADAAGRRHGLFGMIYVVAKQNWTIDGDDAAPGRYAGTLEVTVTAGEQ